MIKLTTNWNDGTLPPAPLFIILCRARKTWERVMERFCVADYQYNSWNLDESLTSIEQRLVLYYKQNKHPKTHFILL